MATRKWTANGANARWDTGANWTGGVAPTSTDDVIFTSAGAGGGSGNCYISVTPGLVECKTLTIAGYTGTFGLYTPTPTFSTASSEAILVHGSVSIAPFLGRPSISIDTTGTLSASGVLTCSIGITGSAVVTNTGSFTCPGLSIGASATLALGATTITETGTLTYAGTLTWTSGGLILAPTGAGACSVNQTSASALPPTVINTAFDVRLISTLIKFTSLTLTAGELKFGSNTGSRFNLQTTGNLSFNGGTLTWLGGRTVTVGGNFVSSVDLIGDSAWTLAVTGTAVEHTHSVTNCTASGTQLDATDSCIDGGGNTNVKFFNAPTVTSASPATGSTVGGTSVTLTGTNFVGVTNVTFGGVAATSIVTVNTTTVTCTTPAHAAGAVDVVVTNGDATTGTAAGAFTFIAPPVITSVTPDYSLPDGDDPIVVTGTNFDDGAVLTIDGDEPSDYTVDSATQISFVSDPHAAGIVDLVVTNEDGQSDSADFEFADIIPEACQINTITLKNNSAYPALFVDGTVVAAGDVHVLQFVGLSCARQEKLRAACVNVANGTVFSIHDVDSGE